ncbi:MAG: hypothetical protein MZV64_05495 [Ignavibacteriales bacterium]|nr:hypothetical protein [Ignavibacteriales bacterium]
MPAEMFGRQQIQVQHGIQFFDKYGSHSIGCVTLDPNNHTCCVMLERAKIILNAVLAGVMVFTEAKTAEKVLQISD